MCLTCTAVELCSLPHSLLPSPPSLIKGEVFIQAKAALEDVYKIYCYHHDDANMSLKSYEKEEEIKQHFTTCVLALK